MSPRTSRSFAAAAVAVAAALALSACAPDAGAGADPVAPSASTQSTPTATPIPTLSPTAKAAAIPTDCRTMLSADVLAQLSAVPLNDPALGPSGPQSDGSLVCVWRDPRADTTGLVTKITRVDRGPALDMLNELIATQGFSCYTPDEGTRCEKTWINETYPVNDGRTLFWRDDVLIDTQYSNLAPTGYTASIITSIFG